MLRTITLCALVLGMWVHFHVQLAIWVARDRWSVPDFQQLPVWPHLALAFYLVAAVGFVCGFIREALTKPAPPASPRKS
jgi:hypothetical protein